MTNRFTCALAVILLFPLPVVTAAQQEAPAGAASDVPAAEAREEVPGEEQAPRRIQLDLKRVLDQARAAVAAGNLEEAVKLYQLILRFAPDARVVRIELSFALTALGERDRAARLLRDVDREGLPPDVIATIDRIVGPGKLNFFFIPELIYDQNINGQTKKDVIIIGTTPLQLNKDAQGRAAYGYGFTLGASYRLVDRGPRTTLTLGTRMRDLNARQDDAADLFGSMSFAFEPGERTTLVPSISGTYRTRAGDKYEAEYAGGAALGFDLGPVRTTLSGRHRFVEGLGDFEEQRDRKRSEAGLGLGYGFDRVGVRFDGQVFREDWIVTETQDNEGFRAGLDLVFVGAPWLTPTIGGSVMLTSFENEATFFNIRRLDRIYEGHVELVVSEPDIFGLDPVIRYTYRHATSNIPLFEYNEHGFSLAFKAITF